ncbi:MAG: 3-deoxy-D-manno-octulosonic acid transferase [Candidatus Omnitrophica bacterium]|nr:3-deoxy-D-manno-octulosonic acid transferase [Candidatus Omnitrophota bacterium]
MLYDIAFFIFSVFYVPALVFKGKLHRDFAERFGNYGEAKERALCSAKDVIWIQAVSVGEVALCRSLIPLIKKQFPGRSIVFSTITRTGNDLAKKLFGGEAIILYFPLDFSVTAKKAVDKIRPALYIMVETEIWPNVLKELLARSVPAILINGRISDRSIDKYMMAKPFIKKALGAIRAFCMQSDIDAERIKAIGAEAGRVRVTGNMKFDSDAPAVTAGQAGRGLFGLKRGDLVFVAGSTHGGEEEALILVYRELLKEFPCLKLVIAPRHIERTHEVENIIRRLSFEPVRLSVPDGAKGPARKVYLIDEIGHLNDAYAMAEIVFIGGSLIPHGGQNPIEPAALGKSVIFGPYMFNFRTVIAALLKNGAAIQVRGQEELAKAAVRLLKDGSARNTLGENAKKVVEANRGASIRNIEVIKGLIDG